MSPAGVLSRLRTAFAAARDSSRIVNADLRVAGTATRLHFADPALGDALLPSLGGMRAEPEGSPTANIHAWSGANAAFPCPQLQQALADRPGVISAINAGTIHLQYNPDGEILSCIDTANGEAYYYVGAVDRLPFYEICTPMRLLVNWLCRMSGALMVHAAVAGEAGHGVLIIGRSGAGKSTTGIQCLLHGMDYLGDDYVAISGPQPTVAHHLYRGCKVMDDALDRLPALRPFVAIASEPGGKNVVMLDERLGHLVPSLEIVAIVRPRVSHAERTSFAPLRPLQAITEFAGSTILQMPGTADFMLRELSRFCSSLPVFEMPMSRDPAEISAALAGFIRQRATP